MKNAFWIATALLFLVACGEPSVPVVPPFEDPVAVRQQDDGIWIRWEKAPKERVLPLEGAHNFRDLGGYSRTTRISRSSSTARRGRTERALRPS